MPENRQDPVTWVVRHVVPPVGLIAVLGIALRLSLRDSINDDTFFHLRIGHELRTGTWSLWSPGSMSPEATRAWVPTQWLSQIIMSEVERLGGLRTLAWVAGAVTTAYTLTLYAVSRRFAPPLVAVSVAGMALVGSAEGLSARPQLVSYLLATVMTAAWLSTARDGRIRWWLVPLAWLWATLHGMWPVAVVIGAVGAAGVVLDRRPSARDIARLASVPVLSLLAAALTPVGPRLVVEVVTVTSRGQYFEEWGPTSFHSIPAAIVALLIAAALMVQARGTPVPWTQALLLLVAGGWAVFAVRTVPVAAAMAAPLAALALGSLVPPAPTMQRRGLVALVTAGALTCVVLAVVLSGRDVGTSRPAGADDYLDDLPRGASVLNAWEWGGYLGWRHPDLDVLVSGYGDMFTTSELDRNVRLMTTDAGWLDDLERLGVRVAVLPPQSRLAYGLEKTAGWSIVRESDELVLLRAPD